MCRSVRRMRMLGLVLGEVATVITTGQRVLPTKPLEPGLPIQVSAPRRVPCRPFSRRAPSHRRPADRVPLAAGSAGVHASTEPSAANARLSQRRLARCKLSPAAPNVTATNQRQAGEGTFGPALGETCDRLEPHGIGRPNLEDGRRAGCARRARRGGGALASAAICRRPGF